MKDDGNVRNGAIVSPVWRWNDERGSCWFNELTRIFCARQLLGAMADDLSHPYMSTQLETKVGGTGLTQRRHQLKGEHQTQKDPEVVYSTTSPVTVDHAYPTTSLDRPNYDRQNKPHQQPPAPLKRKHIPSRQEL